MTYKQRSLTVLLFCLLFAGPAHGQGKSVEIIPPKTYRPVVLKPAVHLESMVDSAVAEVSANLPPGYRGDEIAVTLIDLNSTDDGFAWASKNGRKLFYPASVIKLFFLAALERQFEDKKVVLTKELERGERDMIVDSSNEATQYILDVLTDTSSGGELAKKDFDKWQRKRNRVNRFFAAMGYKNINVNQKTFCEDAYGVEQQSRNYKAENRNMLTTDATARLMAELVLGRLNTSERTSRMMGLLMRDPFTRSDDPDSQSTAFAGKAIAEKRLSGARLWSKAGWTSTVRHDASYIELPSGHRFVLVIFTENRSSDRDVIPEIAGKMIDLIIKTRTLPD